MRFSARSLRKENEEASIVIASEAKRARAAEPPLDRFVASLLATTVPRGGASATIRNPFYTLCRIGA
jgi:hypothetical protein